VADLYYTTDGSEPSEKSRKHEPLNLIQINTDTTIKAKGILMNCREGPPDRTIVRLSTSIWKSRKGIHFLKNLDIQRRLSRGDNFFEEDVEMTGADLVINHIKDFHILPDGLYEVKMIDLKKDWESGLVEEWNWKLTPFKP
jgi:hypothetical protein